MTFSPHSPTPNRNDGIKRPAWFKSVGILAVSALVLLGFHRAPAATFTWDGNGGVGSSNWSTAGNWTVAGVPTQPGTGLDDLQFAGGTKLTPNMQANYNINSITFNTGAGLFILGNTGGTTLTLQGGGVVNNDNSTQTVNISAIVLGASQTWNAGTVAGGSLVFGGATLDLGSSHTLTVDGTNNTSIDNDISGSSSGILKNGSGALTLTGTNTFNGGVSLTAGTLNINSTTALGATASTLTITGGTINNSTGGAITLANNNAQNWNGNFAFTGTQDLNLGTGNVTMNASRTVTVNGGTLTVGGIIDDGASSFSLTKAGAGTLTLSGANTFGTSGQNFTLSAGTLNINHASALGNAANTFIISGGTIDNTSTGSITTSNYAQSWNGNFAFTGTQDLNLGTGNVTLGANRTVTVNGGTLTVGGVIDDGASTFTLTKAGTGTLALGGANTYGGTTSVTGGVLLLNSATALPGGIDTATAAGESALTINGGVVGLGAGDFTRALGAGAGQVQWTGSGGFAAYGADRNVNLGGAAATVTWNSGSFVPTGSTLILGAADATHTVTFQNAIALAGAARTVQVDDGAASVDAILSGALTGVGSSGLTKTGAGTLVINNSGNTYAGVTTVSAGILRATTSANALGSGTLTLSGGNLELANNTGLAFNRNTTVSANATIDSDVLTSGAAGVTHTLGTLSIGAQTLTIGVGGNVGSGTAGITFGAVTLSGNPTFSVDSGALLTMGAITSGGADRTITFGGAGNTTVSGVIDDASGGGNTTIVTKTGNGTLTLATANTYNDITTISGGVVKVQNNTSLGTTTAGTTVASGAAIHIDGNLLNVAEAINGTGLAGDGGGTGALRNLANDNTWSGAITIADTGARINSDGGTLTLSGGINETGASLKTLTFGGAGNITVSTAITADAGDLAVTKTGGGVLNLTAANTYDGATTVSGGTMSLNGANGAIVSSSGITINNGGTLQLDNATINTNRIGTVTVTMNGGTFDFANPATLGGDYTETAGQLSLNSGASTISTDVSNTGASSSSILTFSSLARTAGSGATVNFGGGTGNPSATNDDNNVRFTAQAAGLIGAWATVGGTSYATYNTASATDSVEALTTFNQTLTRLSSGTKVIANTSTNNNQIIDGTGTAGDITLAAATTVINTLTNSAPGTTAPAGGVTIDPAGQTLRAAGILNASGSSALTIGNGVNNGTLTAATAGGELVLQNFAATNLFTVNSVIGNFTGSSLTTSGTGTVVLTAANTYTGATTVAGGTLQIGNAGTTGSLSTSSAITTNGTLAFNRTNTVTQGTDFNSVIAGTGGVTQFGSGTLVLNGTNSYSGVTTFEAGIVNVTSLSNYGVAGPLGNRTALEETVTGVGLYFSGGTLQYTGATAQSTDRSIRVDILANGGATIDASGSNPAATMSFTSSIPNVDPWANPGSRTITLTGSNTGDNIFAINIQEYDDGSSNTSLVKSGAGTWVLTNPHNSDAQTNSYNTYGGYSGGTTVSGGTLGFVEGAIGGGVVDITGNATLRWESGNTQDITTGTGAGVARSLKIEDGVTATFNTNGNDVTLSNAIALGGAGTAAVTKTGAGTLTLGASNAYTGATTVTGGTLDIGTGGALTGTTNVTVNSGGTLLLSGTGANKINNSAAVTLNGGTFSLDGSTSLDEQVGALTLSASSVIDFGTLAAGHILRFADSTGATWGAFTLSVWNWTEGADHLYFGSIFGAGLPVGGLGKILFYYDSGITPTGGAPAAFGPDNGEVSPVPEPSAVLVGLSLLSLAGYRERRWLFRCREARRKRTA